ncbi:beta-galactosidase trimerization domain-containing protein [Shinella sp.]|uniref:beta-galactosidase trimerization domain-containing protein n=1 Tax=Shinella sp. TaxID=1870904 RepID=UPI003F7116D9
MTQASPHEWLKTSNIMIMTMREDDAGRWDPQKLVEFAKSLSVDALGFSTAGITAFYPTDIPLHRRSPSLGNRDVVGETLKALNDAGIRAIARIDSSLVPRGIAADHPEWCSRDENGKLMSVHGLYVACPNGGYYREFAINVVREVLGRYAFSGLWSNAAQFSPWHTRVCYCSNCQTKFRAETGRAIPKQNWSDPLWRRYNELRYRWIAEWVELMDKTIEEVRPECAWMPLAQVMESWDHSQKGGWDIDYTAPFADMPVLEAQRRYANLWWPGVEARYLRGIEDDKPGAVIVSYFLPWWRLYSVPEAENRVWASQIVAHGCRPWLHVTGFFSEHFDRRGLEPMRKLFKLFADNRDAYAGLKSQADAAIIYSRFTQDNIDGENPEPAYINHFRGAYNALMQQRIPFDVLSDKRITPQKLARYKAVLLPNGACLNDEAVDALRAYVDGGGRLIASFEATFRDAMGEPRDKPLVLELLGAQDTHTIERNLKAAYGRITDPESPFFNGITNTDVLPIGGDLKVLAGPGTRAEALAYVPPVEGEPGSGFSVPEYNFIERVSTYSLIMTATLGKGSLVYFPWPIEQVAHLYGLADLFQVIGNAVRATPGWTDKLRVTGPGFYDLSLMAKDNRLSVTVINFSAPGSFNSGHRRLVHEVMPVSDVKVDVSLPAGKTCSSARFVVSGEEAPFEVADGVVRLTIPKLTEFETISFTLE